VEAPRLDSLGLDEDVSGEVARLAAGPGLVFATGLDPLARAALLYACARAAVGPARRVVTIERAVSFVVPEFVQVELGAEYESGAAVTLSQPGDVFLAEDLDVRDARLAAARSAAEGALVLAGLAAPSAAFGLAALAEPGAPRELLLRETRALVHVERQGSRHHARVLPVTDELRSGLSREGQMPWTSRTS
jgi:hypothetical protein